MDLDSEKLDQCVLALLRLGLHEGSRAWKGFDWEIMARLHEKGFISNPQGNAKSILLGDRRSSGGTCAIRKENVQRLFSFLANKQRFVQVNINWSAAFQILAFCLGWGAAVDNRHPIGAFFGTWFLFAAVFWFLGMVITSGGGGKSSGEGPGASNDGDGGGGGGGGGGGT